MYCLLVPGLALLAFSLFTWVKVVNFRRNAQLVTAEVCWLAGGAEFAHYFKKKNMADAMRDKEFVRRHRYGLFVRIRPPDGEPLERGLTTGRPLTQFKHGDQVQVLFNPNQSEYVLLPDENMGLGPFLVGFMGLILTLGALSVVYQLA